MDEMASRRFGGRFVAVLLLRYRTRLLELFVVADLFVFLFRRFGSRLVRVTNRFTQIHHHENHVPMDA